MNEYFSAMNERRLFVKAQSGGFSLLSLSLFHFQVILTKMYLFPMTLNFHILRTPVRTEEFF